MPSIEVGSFGATEGEPASGRSRVATVAIGGRVVRRAVYEPGWHWSVDVGPGAGTRSCRESHLGYVLSGRMRVRADDGSEGELGPGDAFALRPGHDAEVVGDEPCVLLDLGGLEAGR